MAFDRRDYAVLSDDPAFNLGGYCMDWMEKDKPQHHSKVVRYEDEDDDQ